MSQQDFEKTQKIRAYRPASKAGVRLIVATAFAGCLGVFLPPLDTLAALQSRDMLMGGLTASRPAFTEAQLGQAVQLGLASPSPISAAAMPFLTGPSRDDKASTYKGSEYTSYTCLAPLASDAWTPQPLPETTLGVDEIGLLSYVGALAKHLELDANLVLGVIQQESNFDAKAKSHAGAIGLMQLMPEGGAREAYRIVSGKDSKIKPKWLDNPEFNVIIGMSYLAFLNHRYRAIPAPGLRQATVLSAYNAGPGRLDRAIRNAARIGQEWSFTALINSMPKETRNYFVKVDRYKDRWESLNHPMTGEYFDAASQIEVASRR